MLLLSHARGEGIPCQQSPHQRKGNTMDKNALRKQKKAERTALSPALLQQKSEAIRATLTQSEAWRSAQRIFTYLSIQNEVNTRALVQQAWAEGKTVAVPVCAAGGVMQFVPITPQTVLHQTKYGTQEPALNVAAVLHPDAGDLVLVPGLVFDACGNRYGYGGGFYDRYLAAHPACVPIALCFAFQISPQPLDAAPHDMPMARLLSEEGWHVCHSFLCSIL